MVSLFTRSPHFSFSICHFKCVCVLPNSTESVGYKLDGVSETATPATFFIQARKKNWFINSALFSQATAWIFFFNSMNPLALRLLTFSILNLSLKRPTRGSIIKWIPLASSPGAFKKCQTFGVGHEINKNKKQDCSQPGGGPASIWESPGVHLPRDGCSWEGVGSSRWLLCAELASEKTPHSPKLIFSRCSTSAIHLSRLIYSEITTTMY